MGRFVTLKKTKSIIALAISSLFLLAACDDDSSSSPVTPSDSEESSSSIALAESSSSVLSPSSWSSERTIESSSSKDKAKSSSSVKNEPSSSVIPGSDPESSSSVLSSLSWSSEGTIGSSSSKDKAKSSSSVKSESSSSVKTASSSSVPSSSSWSPTGAIGSMTDSRDGQTYKTVVIGTQTWMAENLNYETKNSYCYDGYVANCTMYGRLYTWAAAMDSVGTWSTNGKGCGYRKTCSPTYPVRGVCPDGWHLPTQTEWNTLFNAVGGSSVAGTMLKSTSGWYSNGNGTDAFSFSALPAGDRDYYGGSYCEGLYANFWSSTGDDRYACLMHLYHGDDAADLRNSYKIHGHSVRCLQD